MKKAPGSSSDGSIGVSNDGQSNDSSARPLVLLLFFFFYRGPPLSPISAFARNHKDGAKLSLFLPPAALTQPESKSVSGTPLHNQRRTKCRRLQLQQRR